MNFATLFVRRPVTTTLIQVAIVIFGIMGYRTLPVSDLPTIDYPTIQVSANLPGANPDTMASAVATPLEKQFTTIAGIDAMTSTSSLGSTTITLQFALDRNIDAAAQDVQTAISRTHQAAAAGHARAAVVSARSNPADSPILYLALTSATLPLSRVDEIRRERCSPSASRWSTAWRSSRSTARRNSRFASTSTRLQLAARGIGIDEVATADSERQRRASPTGTLLRPATRRYTVMRRTASCSTPRRSRRWS